MSATVIVNNLTVVHKRSGGSSVAGPDVCKTPAPGAPPVPVPYVNTALSRATAKGSRSLRIDGESIMLKSSHFATSAGDEPGALGGVISGKVKGKAKPKMYSFDVRVEGQNVVRLTDIMLQNSGSPPNTPPGIVTQPNVTAGASDPDRLEVVKMAWSRRELACGDAVTLAIDTKNAEGGEVLTVMVRRTDRKALNMDQFPVTMTGNHAEHPWISRRTSNFAVKVPAVAVQHSALGVERSAEALTFKSVADAKELIPWTASAVQFRLNPDLGEYEYTGKLFGWEVCYQIEAKSGALVVTRKMDFDNRTGRPISPRTWRAWRREIEGVWDRKFFLHRKYCKRGHDCDCVQHGCCKFPLRILAEQGAGHGTVTLFAGGPRAVNAGKVDLWWYSHTWWTRRGQAASPVVRAHEFGHLIGCFDEYLGGASNPAGLDIEDDESVMGAGTEVEVRHVQHFLQWFAVRAGPVIGKIEAMKG